LQKRWAKRKRLEAEQGNAQLSDMKTEDEEDRNPELVYHRSLLQFWRFMSNKPRKGIANEVLD
jgi:hypothetical protein